MAIAFPDPSDEDLLHLVVWASNAGGGALRRLLRFESDAFREVSAAAPRDSGSDKNGHGDGFFHAYTGGDEAESLFLSPATTPTSTPTTRRGSRAMIQNLCFPKTLAGYAKLPPPVLLSNENRDGPDSGAASAASASASSPFLPMIGIFRRAIRPGENTQEELARTFQKVCDIWYETVPGILAAVVAAPPPSPNEGSASAVAAASVAPRRARDEATNPDSGAGVVPRFVHDVRIFADKASYSSHVDKSNHELTEAMETWFAHYDVGVPHTGVMIATPNDTADPAVHQSSIEDKPIVAAFNVFHYGRGGCTGTCFGVGY